MRKPLWTFGLAALAACGAAGNLAKFEKGAGVIQGGIDPSLVGTFRLSSQSPLGQDELQLLVLRTDRTFHAEYIASCPDSTCEGGTISLDGTYEQVRELPDPTRASGISLTGQFVDGGGQPQAYAVALLRAAIPDSPQTGLYHPAEPASDAGLSRPFFMLAHPVQAWCAAQSDCDSQNLLDGSACAAFACQGSTCACQ